MEACKRTDKKAIDTTRRKEKMSKFKSSHKLTYVPIPAAPAPSRNRSSPNSHPSGYRAMSSPNFHLNDLPYTKLICHALKYPHKTVNGLLLGHHPAPNVPIEIVDAVPLQHHWTNLSPMMEIGLGMVRPSFPRLLFFFMIN